MIVTHNQQTASDEPTIDPITSESSKLLTNIKSAAALSAQLLLPVRVIAHHPKAGLNPIADTASHLLSILGKLKLITHYRQPSKLRQELIQEINLFQETIKHHGYNQEYIAVCRYILCATFDDIISNTEWGSLSAWENLSLLTAFNQDTQHQDKFFNIMERSLKEPSIYIDLLELMYICLSMGYKGQYRATEHSHYQLELITNNLYKHIRSYRGGFSKALSPAPLKARKATAAKTAYRKSSLLFIFFATACIIMIIFVSLSYLMDVISNEAYKNIAKIQNPVSHETTSPSF